MINRKHVVEIKINGKQRTLVFDNNAVSDLEEIFGRHPIAVIRDLGESMRKDPLSGKIVSTLRALLWAGLKQRSPGIKIEHVGSSMVREEFGEYLRACTVAILANFGVDQDELEKKSKAVEVARRKQSDGEELTEEERKAIEEADNADPLALSDVTEDNGTPLSSTNSENGPSDAV